MKQALYTYVVWVLVTVLQAAIAYVMFRRGQHREFPAFFGYTVFHVVQSVVSFIANFASYDAYFYVYWGSEALDAVITLLVLQEVFANVLTPYEALRRIGSALFRWSTVAFCMIALISAAMSPGTNAHPFIRGLFAMERSIEFMKAGLMLFVFIFCRLFGLTWRHVLFGLALGFGVSASIGLVGASVAAQFPSHVLVYKFLMSKSFAVGVFIWSYYFFAAETVAPVIKLPNSRQLRKWNEALAAVINQ